jgi:hypothetical protein
MSFNGHVLNARIVNDIDIIIVVMDIIITFPSILFIFSNFILPLHESEMKPKFNNSVMLDDRGFDSRQGLGIFLFTTASRSALGSTQPPIQ